METITDMNQVAAPVSTMQAFVMKGLNEVGFMRKPIPVAGPYDAVIKTARALVCTSDAHTVHGAIGLRDQTVPFRAQSK
jgi:D-arabinose 1-dehydrogenase-like Zn-dependent alcohol dehydrogenase